MMSEIEQAYWRHILNGRLPSIGQPGNFPGVVDMISVINEDRHSETNIGQAAYGYLLSKTKLHVPERVDLNELGMKIINTWPFYDDFMICCVNAGVRLYMLKADFNNLNEAARAIRKIDSSISIDLVDNPKVYGLTLEFSGGLYVIVINEEFIDNPNTILHEFTHFVQLVTKKLQFNENGLSNTIIDFFNLTNDNASYVRYVCSENEFYAHVYNDLFNGLQKIYWKYFKDIYSWEDYITVQMKELKSSITTYRESFLSKIWKDCIDKDKKHKDKNNSSSSAIIDIIACISYVDENLFSDIVDKLKNKQ